MFYRFSKTEITDFTLVSFDEYIGGFKISMYDILVIKVLDSFHDLFEVWDSLLLS